MESFARAGRHIADIASPCVALGALVKFLPPLAALFSLAWSGVQLYDYFRKKRTPTQHSTISR